jgi:hypothetical protein
MYEKLKKNFEEKKLYAYTFYMIFSIKYIYIYKIINLFYCKNFRKSILFAFYLRKKKSKNQCNLII